jgi:hypothetical protein
MRNETDCPTEILTLVGVNAKPLVVTVAAKAGGVEGAIVVVVIGFTGAAVVAVIGVTRVIVFFDDFAG